jgi:predicted transcriptional regulator
MSDILISIHPRHVEKILSGEKRFEYRKRVVAHRNALYNALYIYATKPVCKVVAKAWAMPYKKFDKEYLWRITCHSSGITKKEFDEYFKDSVSASCYKIITVEVFNPPHDLKDYGFDRPPQSYAFIKKRKGEDKMANGLLLNALEMGKKDVYRLLDDLKRDGVFDEKIAHKILSLFNRFKAWAISKEDFILDFSKRVYFYLPTTDGIYQKLQDEWSLYSADVFHA